MGNPRKKNRSSRKLNRDASVTGLQEEQNFGEPSTTQQSHPRAHLKTQTVRKLATTKQMSKEVDYSSKVDLNHWTVYEIDYSDLNDADESTLPWEKIKLLVKVANLAGNDRVIGDVLNYDEAPAVDGTLDERSLVSAESIEANKNRNNQLAKATDVIDLTLMSCRSRRKRKSNKRSNKEETASPAGCERGRKTDGTSTSPLKKKSKPTKVTKATLVSDKTLTPLKAQRVASRKVNSASSSSQRKSLKRSKKDPVVEAHTSQELSRSGVEEVVQVPQRIERIWTPLDHLLQSPLGLLSMEQGGITVVENTASSKPFFLFPSAMEVNPLIANAPPGSLILVPSNEGDPANQMVHIYRISIPSELLPN